MTQEEFNLKFMSKLNNSQEEAVYSVDNPTLLLAVPGSGKTTVLVTRLGFMVCVKNINPKNILTMTYTVAATKEMKKRFVDMFGEYTDSDIEFRTINGISSIIINYYAKNHGKSEPFKLIENDGELSKILREIYMEVNEEYPLDSIIKDIKTGITYIKNMMLSQEEIDNIDINNIKNLSEIYNKYCLILKKNRQMDYDDQMVYAFNILKGFPPVLEYFQDKYKYICVDESQDTSKIQHEIIKILANKYNNIFMVGDEDQSIYGFRAAFPEALMNFSKDYQNGKILFMEENYRSAKGIIDVANSFVSSNRFRYEKTIKPTRDLQTKVQTIWAIDRISQYKYLFEISKKCDKETAILYRNNDSALPLIDMLERNNIPYNCKKFDEVFFSNIVVKDITDIMSFAYNPNDEEIFMKIYYKLGLALSKKTALDICARSNSSGLSILEELEKSSELKKFAKDNIPQLKMGFSEILQENAEKSIQTVFEKINYGKYMEEKKFDLGKVFILMMLARNEKTAKNLIERLEELKYIIKNHKNNIKTNFMLSTIHSSKGLEYESVYLLDIIDTILPSITESEAISNSDIKLYEEERRLYYVAMTRAKNELYLFRCRGVLSSFTSEVLPEIPIEIVDEKDVFASLKQDLCGKTYDDTVNGKGVIIAQHKDKLLLEYSDTKMEILDIATMFVNRNKDVQYQKPKILTSKQYKSRNTQNHSNKMSLKHNEFLKTNIRKGTAVTHKTLGKGVIVETNGDSIEISFKDKTIRRFSLSICLEKGLIKL